MVYASPEGYNAVLSFLCVCTVGNQNISPVAQVRIEKVQFVSWSPFQRQLQREVSSSPVLGGA